MTERLKIAVQKSGRLTDVSLELLERCGLEFARSKDKLFCYGRNMPVDLLLVRDDDIPEFLREGICDLGIVGDNVAEESMIESQKQGQSNALERITGLGYGKCRLSIAIKQDVDYQSIQALDGSTIATSYPNLLNRHLTQNQVKADIAYLSGSVEIAPRLGTAEAICDLVSSGATLAANNLKEAEVIFESEAALYKRDLSTSAEKKALVDRLLIRLESVLKVAESKYVMFHAPKAKLDEITAILPSAEAPTILPLGGTHDTVAVHTLCRETVFWEHLEQLKAAGASAILVLPVEKMLA